MTTQPYWTSIHEMRDGLYWSHTPAEYPTLDAAKDAVLSTVPTDDRRFQFAASVNEWDQRRVRCARYWPMDTATRTFLDPVDVPPVAVGGAL